MSDVGPSNDEPSAERTIYGPTRRGEGHEVLVFEDYTLLERYLIRDGRIEPTYVDEVAEDVSERIEEWRAQ